MRGYLLKKLRKVAFPLTTPSFCSASITMYGRKQTDKAINEPATDPVYRAMANWANSVSGALSLAWIVSTAELPPRFHLVLVVLGSRGRSWLFMYWATSQESCKERLPPLPSGMLALINSAAVLTRTIPAPALKESFPQSGGNAYFPSTLVP